MTEPVILPYPRKRKSPLVTAPMAAKIKAMIKLGMMQHDIERSGATHIHVHKSSSSAVERRAEEADLVAYWDPPCND